VEAGLGSAANKVGGELQENTEQTRRLLVLGLGNPIVSDDAVGFAVIEKLTSRLSSEQITITTGQAGGLALLDIMVGYDSVIVVDAIMTGRYKPGEIVQFQPEDFAGSRRGAAVHDVSLFQALELGRRIGLSVPRDIRIVAIEIQDNVNVAEKLTPEVQAAVDPAVEMVVKLVSEMGFEPAH